MTGLSLGLSLEAGAGRTLAARVRPSQLLDIDFARDRFRHGARAYPSLSALLAAAGGVAAGAALTFGPHVDPDAEDLLVNGDFSAGDLSGWTVVAPGGGTASVVGGAARLASTGAPVGITQSVTVVADTAYLARYRVLGGTTNFRIGGLSPTAAGPAGGTRAPGLYADSFSADGTPSHFYAFRSGDGTVSVDDLGLKPCTPLAGMDRSGITVEISASVAADADGVQILWSCGHLMTADAGDDIAILRDGAGHLRVRCRYAASVVVDLDLGTVAPGGALDVRVSFSPDLVSAQRGDGPIRSMVPSHMAGFGVMRVGHDHAGNAWTGEIARLGVFAGGARRDLERLATGAIRFEGDSFAISVMGVSLPATLEALMDRGVITTAIGNSTAADIAARMGASGFAHLLARTTIIWDGSENPVATLGEVPDYLDHLAAAVTALGHHRYVMIPPCANLGETDFAVHDAIRIGFLSRWPGHCLDWRDHLHLDGNGAPTAAMFADPETDTTHLGQVAMGIMAAAIAGHLAARGW